jgi:hypothetical protein
MFDYEDKKEPANVIYAIKENALRKIPAECQKELNHG